jgi:hypothetical protein
MSEVKHAPGPWVISGEFKDEADLQILDDNDGGVCLIGPYTEEWTDTEKANARLIAAAPELLKILKAALEDSGCDGDLCMRQWHEDARKAIDNAEGRQ